jgi:hypothetical protein
MPLPNDCRAIGTVCRPVGVAFDSVGTMWVATRYSIVAFLPATLQSAMMHDFPDSGPAGDFLISNQAAWAYEMDAGMGTGQPYAGFRYQFLAFDASGNLWVTAMDQSRLVPEILEFSGEQLSQLQEDPTPEPIVTIVPSAALIASGLSAWGALAFDTSGNLWVGAAATSGPNLFRFPAGGLSAAAQPDVAVRTPSDPSLSLVFDPPSAGTPLD